MDIEALPLFDLSFEGYCRAVTEYALTANPDILTWISAIDRVLASGELVWKPAQTTQERQQRLQIIHNMLTATSFFCKHRAIALEILLSA